MIRIWLEQFGGRGGSGGGGAGTGRGGSSVTGPGHHGSAGGPMRVQHEKPEQKAPEKKSQKLSKPIEGRITDPQATYVVTDQRGTPLMTQQGADLNKLIRSGKLRWVAAREKWVWADGRAVIIRKRG